MDQGQSSRDFAFTYRLDTQVVPDGDYDVSSVDFNAPGLSSADQVATRSNNWAVAGNLRTNLNQIRLRFRWPILPNGSTGNGRQIFRSAASGRWSFSPTRRDKTAPALYLIQPHSYAYAGQ